ncbi:hypothetical protein ECG_00546 [Echinococcus granulosus]|uniref:Homeobox protein meis3 n=1 Tax=Echinococcus granulosus TaxID=6210 RepID=A0A068WAA4_ECHGR|nr:hypothetical protein ECG_00546 [Echinococcus granulosus]CDS16606.1 homeobox protein meis3 [Echinococcus granulosus]
MGLLPKFDAQEILSLHCPLCSFHSHWTEKLESHFVKSHLGRTAEFNLYQCSMCKKIASSKAFILEHLELQHRLVKEEVEEEETPTSPSSDSDVIMRSDGGEMVQRPGSTPGTHLNVSQGCAVPIFSGRLRGGEMRDGEFHYQCLFCEFSTCNREVLASHYVHHGIKNLQCSERPLAATAEASQMTTKTVLIKSREKSLKMEDMELMQLIEGSSSISFQISL